MSPIPPLDPHVAARRGFREPEDRIRRFWTAVEVARDSDGWRVLLDGRPPRTPAGAILALPTEAAARLVAEEWVAQDEHVSPAAMPATRLVSTAIDRIGRAREAVADEVAAYAGSDVLCYLAEAPVALAEQQARAWTPWRDWAARELAVELIPVEGVIHRSQAPEALARVRELALALDDFSLTGLAALTPLLGSAVLALAVTRGALSGAEAFDLSRIDEVFQESHWGVDAESALRADARRDEAVLLDRWLRSLAP